MAGAVDDARPRDGAAPDADIPTKAAARQAAMAAWMLSFADRADAVAALDAANIAWADVRDATTLLDSPSLRHGQVVEHVDDHAGGHARRDPHAVPLLGRLVRRARPGARAAASTTPRSSPTGSARRAAEVDALVADGTLQRA